MINNLLKILVMFFGLGLLNHAEAARPMLTDDARIVDPKSCQLESWVRVQNMLLNIGRFLPAMSEKISR